MSESSPHLAGSPQKIALGELVAETGWFSAETPLTVHRSGYRDVEQPEASFIVPVFNQADVIAEHLTAIRTNARSRHEVIVIVDGCTDGTLREVLAWQHDVDLEGSDRRTCGVTVVEIGEGIFETLSDSVGAALATGTYLVEVQADMLIEDPGFDMGMSSALARHPELIIVGGRGAHSFAAAGIGGRSPVRQRLARKTVQLGARTARAYGPTRFEHLLSDSIGRVGVLIDTPRSFFPEQLFVHETTMRGPWAIRKDDFETLGGFDTARFFLGNDDHDIAFRALQELNRRAAYLPIRFSSPLELGSTRAPRPEAAAQRFSAIRRHYEDRFASSALASGVPELGSPSRYVIDHPWRTA